MVPRRPAVAAGYMLLLLLLSAALSPPVSGRRDDAHDVQDLRSAGAGDGYAPRSPSRPGDGRFGRRTPADRHAAPQARTGAVDPGAAADATGSNGLALPAGPSIGWHRRPHAAPRPGEVLDLGIRELGNFDFDVGRDTPVPADVVALGGHTVRLRGFMVPLDQAQAITRFALVPSLYSCCYGQPPQVQHTVVVGCPTGKAVSYYPDEVVVLGRLSVGVVRDDGFVVSVFSVEAASVKPAIQ